MQRRNNRAIQRDVDREINRVHPWFRRKVSSNFDITANYTNTSNIYRYLNIGSSSGHTLTVKDLRIKMIAYIVNAGTVVRDGTLILGETKGDWSTGDIKDTIAGFVSPSSNTTTNRGVFGTQLIPLSDAGTTQKQNFPGYVEIRRKGFSVMQQEEIDMPDTSRNFFAAGFLTESSSAIHVHYTAEWMERNTELR